VKAWLPDYTAFDQFIPGKEFIIAYPEGPIQWDSTPNGHDLPFFDALVSQVDKEFSIDRSRVYVFGHSNGAAFATFLLCARPDAVAAVAAHSGIFPLGYQRSPAPLHKAPLFVIWGEKDEFSPAASDAVQGNIKPIRKRAFPWKRWCCRLGPLMGRLRESRGGKNSYVLFRPLLEESGEEDAVTGTTRRELAAEINALWRESSHSE